jgi:methanogenic corrinoid protein MtbC1
MTDPAAIPIGQDPSDARLAAVVSADRSPSYNTAAVARRTKVLPATFRAWERRYGFPCPQRDAANRRRYSEQDVRAIEWLRDGLGQGLTISTALAVLRQHLERPARQAAADAVHTPAELTGDLARALLAFDEHAAEAILGEAFALYPLTRVCLEVIQPSLEVIGEGWAAGQVDVSQEHFASTLVRRRLAELFRIASPARSDRLALAACASGDWHELGLLTVALFLARAGWRVVYLGASVPADNLLASADRLQPDAVVLSATMRESATALAGLAERLAERPTPRPLLAFGGRAFESDAARPVPVAGLYLGPSAATAVQRLEQALAEARRSAAR